MALGLNGGGRGFNIVIVDTSKREVSRVGHFDTYAEGASLDLHVTSRFSMLDSNA